MKGNDLVAIIIAAAALFWPQISAKLPLPKTLWPTPTPAVVVATPSAADQQAVAPVVAAIAGSAHRAKHAEYWRDMATLIELHPEDFASPGALIAQHQLASKCLMDLAPGGAPGLAEAFDAAIKKLFGDDGTGIEDKAVDKAEALRVVRALEWSCSQ